MPSVNREYPMDAVARETAGMNEQETGNGRSRGAAHTISYNSWSTILRERFYNETRAGKPATLFVDDDILDEIAAQHSVEDGVASLTDAVRSRLSLDSHGRRFARLEDESSRWKATGGDSDPPALPLLALAVLAASRMGAADGLATHNYWRRFRNLFGFTQNDLKGNGEAFPSLWQHLRWWLDDKNEGRLGYCTAKTHPNWTIIGYALSQALFREADRRRLTEFFQKISLEPGEQLPSAELLTYFRAWAPLSPLGSNAKAIASDPDYEEWLVDILGEEAAHWDGVVRDETGRRVGRLAIGLETFPAPSYFLVAQRPDTFPISANFANEDGVTFVADGDAGAWYAETLPLDPDWLTKGLRLEHEAFVLSYRPARVIALGEDADMGCWVSVTRIQPGEDYQVLAQGGVAEDVREFLGAYDLDGVWHEITRPGAAPPGWTLFTDVAIRPVPPSATIPEALKPLVPSPRERLTLRDGLILNRAIALYLVGGEPDLWLPTLLTEESVTVTVGNLKIEAAPGQRVELRELGLPAGTHTVTAGPGDPLTFTTVQSLGALEGEGSGTLGIAMNRSGSSFTSATAGAAPLSESAGSIWIAGAALTGDTSLAPPARETIVLPLHAREYVLLGRRPGEIMRPSEPAGRPEWMTSVGDAGLFPFGYEVHPAFDPVWVIVERAGGTTVRLRHHATPSMQPADDASGKDIRDWCTQISRLASAVGDGGSLEPLVGQYEEAAEAVGTR
jgi:hypothetical protein